MLVTLPAVDVETGQLDPNAPFLVNGQRREARYNGPYQDEPEVIAQFFPGEMWALFEAEWTDEGWKFGNRVRHA